MTINLDPQQDNVIMAQDKNILCLAGAGSGKTRVLVERAARLIEQEHVSPHELLLCSYTRKASGELKERIVKRTGASAHKIIMGTNHSVALRYLRQFGDLIGWKAREITVYSEFEENFLMREIATDLGIFNGKSWKIPRGKIQETFDKYYHEGIPPEEDNPACIVFSEFILRTREYNSLSYGEILVEFYKMLPKISSYLNIKHIFVDEIQDNNLLQHKLFKRMADLCDASLFFVGDLDQAIFQWRGGCPEYLIDHQEEFKVFKIETNYRSVPVIVTAANNLIGHNVNRITRDMTPNRQDHGQITIEGNADSEKVARMILSYHDNHPNFGETTAVLGRNHFLLRKIATILESVRYPFTYIGRTNELIQSQTFRQFHAFLKLSVNPYDSFSFLLIKDFLGISRKEYSEIRLKAIRESKSHFQVWRETPSEKSQWWDMWETEPFEIQVSELENFPWIEDAAPILSFIRVWKQDNPRGTIQDYLDWLAVFDLQDEIREDDTRLKLMTIHGAKGLEFKTVILIGVNEGIIPSKQSIDSGDDVQIQNERNLMYVACTRAEDHLILAVRPEEKTDDKGKVYKNPVSRFVGEMKG